MNIDTSNNEEILVELIMTLECEEVLNYNKASLLQGVIMENIDSDYASLLHGQGMKPYSQCIRIEDGKNNWYIRTLSLEAYKNIIQPLAEDSFKEFELKHDSIKVKIIDKQLRHIDKKSLFKDFYSVDADRVIKIDFLTPTAFKKNGGYYNFPDLRNIYNSLMNRYDTVFSDESMSNDETLEQLAENTNIISYNLHSTIFHLESIKIPAFLGTITVKIKGPQTMTNFANLLFRFGDYSGIGMKTAMGMGCIKVSNKKG